MAIERRERRLTADRREAFSRYRLKALRASGGAYEWGCLRARARSIILPALEYLGPDHAEFPMAPLTHLQFSTTIHAPPAVVWHHVTDPDSYQRWTSAFSEGSRFEGSWGAGDTIRFLGPSGHGIVAEIAERREHEFLSIRHLGYVAGGVDDTTSDAVQAWAPALENYTLAVVPEGTRMQVDQDLPAEWADHLSEAWPRALHLLKGLSEQSPPTS